MQSIKDFGDLPEAEQRQKLVDLTRLLAENGLGHLKPKILDQVVCPMKAPAV
jgi:hypothetical protein